MAAFKAIKGKYPLQSVFQMFRISKSESVFAHELEPFVHMRTKDLSGRSKNRTKRRSEPRNVFEDKEKGNYKNSSRKSWHQETEARQVMLFKEINCSDGRHSKILYEIESRNGLTRSRKS